MRSTLMVLVSLLAAGTVGADPVHRIGGGLHYLYNVGDLKTSSINSADLSKNSFGILGSYQNDRGLFKIEGDVEYIFDYIGTNKSLVEPSAWVLVGGRLYGGGGVGIGYTNGDWMTHGWYGLRAGMNIPLGGLDLDVFGTYRGQDAGEFKNLGAEDLNAVTFAAILRVPL